MVFSIHQHESAMDEHHPILKTPPTSLPTPTLWVVPEHQLWAPCFMRQIYNHQIRPCFQPNSFEIHKAVDINQSRLDLQEKNL